VFSHQTSVKSQAGACSFFSQPFQG